MTFDDNFPEVWYDQLRPVLASYQARATFFVSRYYTTSSARRALLAALAAEGHEIASHTMDHADTALYGSTAYVQEQVIPDIQSLAAGGHFARDFAYPYGNSTPAIDAALLPFFDFIRDATNNQAGSTLVPRLDKVFRRCDSDRRVSAVGIDVSYGHSDQELLDGLDRARCEGSSLMVYGHYYGTPPPDRALSYFTPERLRLLLDGAVARGLRFRRVRDLCAWQASAQGSGAPARVNDSPLRGGDVRFADLDGDGRSDAFQATGPLLGKWRWLRSQGAGFYLPGGAERWTDLNSSAATLPELALGDFNGDGKADVLYADGAQWLLSSGGSGPLLLLNRLPERVAELAFGDFNGDGKLDAFRASGTRWYVSYGGATAWTQINSSTATLGELGFGDFNGDRKTDVLRAVAGQWKVSYGGTGAWVVLNSAVTEGLASVRFGDFNGDGKTDALRATGTEWSVSSGAAAPWVRLRLSAVPLSELSLADIDGDRRTDVLYTAAPQD